MITITIPGEAVPQRRPRFTKMGNFVKVYEEKICTDFKKHVATVAAEQQGDFEMVEAGVPMWVTMTFYMNRPKAAKKRVHHVIKPDLDNLAKGVLDGLAGTLFYHDQGVVGLYLEKEYSDNPRTEVTIHLEKPGV